MTFELQGFNHKPQVEEADPVKSLKHSSTGDLSVTNHVGDEEAGTIPIKTASAITTGAVILKIPALTWYYWGEKMTATTFGETFADFWSQTLGLGYGATSAVLISMFLVFLSGQLYVKTYIPPLFWAVMATSSIAGTLVSDFIDRTLHWGYPLGMGVLLSVLAVILGLWKLSGLHMNVAGAMTRTQEGFYWAAILTSNTLGTALGDFLADSLEWGFALTAGILGAILVVCALLAVFTKFNRVVLFWVAFILTRPFGAAFGDLLTKGAEKGGLDLGTGKASIVIFALFILFFGYEHYTLHHKNAKGIVEKEEIDEAEEASSHDMVEEA
ncbi:hypothetical protein HJC23_003769 [Cyclotella cryptica]|uniref:Membrane-anchored protein n=1 Tax=Cyclotella cryptica TaxID=29204 RepID=A0ABD3QZU0_9STRA|eukprot:CCRYP_002213-RA/>CCRYP_002213-RA protein AED:0.22 eAED:0.22 QI:0/-1/0/1/-1/1/1/0/326